VFPSNGGQLTPIDVYNNEHGFFTDDMMLYFNAILRDQNGVQCGEAFRSMELFAGESPADVDGAGYIDVDDLLLLLDAWRGCL
jgi:hypothetical protein